MLVHSYFLLARFALKVVMSLMRITRYRYAERRAPKIIKKLENIPSAPVGSGLSKNTNAVKKQTMIPITTAVITG